MFGALSSIAETIQFKLVVAFIVGSIIGLERQFVKSHGPEEDVPGVRTFGLISLLGAAATTIEREFGIQYLVLISFGAVLIWSVVLLLYQVTVKKDIHETTAIAAFLSYMLGVIVGLGMFYWAIVLSVFITAVLSSKYAVKSILASLEYKELTSALTIGLLALVVLPIIPPVLIFGVLNIQLYFIFLVFILVVQFLSYVIIRHLGMRKGFVLFASAGAFVHSEATTVEIARIYNKFKANMDISSAVTAIVAVIITLIVRTLLYLVVLAFMTPAIVYLFTITALPAIAVGIINLAFRLRKYRIQIVEERTAVLKNPLSYSSAAKFALILFGVSVAVVIANMFGREYSVLVAFLSGFYTVSGVELAIVSLLSAGEIEMEYALLVIITALTAGILNKIIYVKYGGGERSLIVRVAIYVVLFIAMLFVGYTATLQILKLLKFA
ncbi:MAG: DUF4010 domain-containing protein [Candidatus Korarchaeota archaeon]|nr:DUF4010 domain-containing protein [Thermoproteota archaeon]